MRAPEGSGHTKASLNCENFERKGPMENGELDNSLADCAENGRRMVAGEQKRRERSDRRRLWVLTAGMIWFVLGSSDLSDLFYINGADSRDYLVAGAACLAMLIYIVPIGVFMKWLAKKYSVSWNLLLLAIGCGILMPGPVAGDVNDATDQFLKSVSAGGATSWIDSLEVGFAEELIKLLVAAMILFVLQKKSFMAWIMTGMSVGLGFQINEDISDIVPVKAKDMSNVFPDAFDRVSVSAASHWAYTALTAAGLWMVIYGKGRRRKAGFGLILFVIANHFLFDSDFGSTNFGFAVVSASLLLMLVYILREYRANARTDSHS